MVSAREIILTILLLITLACGIFMALFISLIMRPISETARSKFVSASGLNLLDMNVRCNCGISGLDYKFLKKENVTELVANTTKSPKIMDISVQKLKNSVGVEAFYDELDYLRSVGVNDDEIVSRLLQMHSNDSGSTSTISSTAVDAAFRAGKGGVAIDKKLVDSIWKMIAAKTLTTTSSVKKKKKKKKGRRSYPDEAPHCFVPLPEKTTKLEEGHILWKYHSNLISISGPKYLDDPEDLRYLCSGAIIRTEYAITGTSCIRDKSLNLLVIRSSSRYWCKEGVQYRILNAFFSPTLALIRIQPNFKLGAENIRNLKIGNDIDFSHATGTSAGWIKDHRRRLAKYTITTWCTSKKIATDNGTCLDSFGHPLIDDAGNLIGIRSCGDAFVKVNEIRSLLIKVQI